MDGNDKALLGLRVVEFWDEIGSYAGRLLADLGAEVIKVEPPGGGRERRTPPFLHGEPSTDSSLAFWVHNSSKKSVVCDLETAEGRGAARRLALGADVILEDNPVGYMAARGLGYEDLHTLQPALVFTSVTGFGQTGPHASYAYSDIVGQAMGGVMTLAGDPADPPNLIYGNQANVSASIHAALGMLAAVRYAEATGHGQRVDVSAQEALSMAQETAMQGWDMQRHNRVRTGGLGLGMTLPGFGLYRSGDGHVFSMAMGVAGAPFSELVDWMREQGRQEDLDSEPYAAVCAEFSIRFFTASAADPEAMRRLLPILSHINDVVSRFFASLSTEDAYVQGQSRRLLIGPVSTPKDIAKSAQLRAREWFVKLETSPRKVIEFPGPPYRLSATPAAIGRPPRLGEHTAQAGEWLRAEPVPATAAKTAAVAAGAVPLSGIRVADFSWFGVGPIATQTLCALGAEVIRVESESKLDSLRSSQPVPLNPDGIPKQSYNVSGYFNNMNAGKLSMQLNLNTAKGRALGHRLIAKSDIFVTNFAPRMTEKWDLSYERLREINPSIIAAYAPMAGMEGPHRDFIGFGAVLTPLTGFSYMSGFPQRLPIGVGTNYPDYVINPGHLVTAILAALRFRERTGEGQAIEAAQLESVVSVLGTPVAEYLANRTCAFRNGNRSPIASPHGAFACLADSTSVDSPDRWVAIACRSDDEWRSLCSAFDAPEVAQAREFATFEARKANEDALDALVNSWTQSRRAEDVMELLQSRGIPAGVVQNAQDLLDRDPHVASRGYYQYLEHPETGRSAYDGVPARLSETPAHHRAPAPLLGEHTFDVCSRVLELDADEIANLMAEGILT